MLSPNPRIVLCCIALMAPVGHCLLYTIKYCIMILVCHISNHFLAGGFGGVGEEEEKERMNR